ncbi:hypothetical protein SLS62_009325 [Diatrype stigma]|uniref:Uncharacterized protein n=1 Tax=Diatrype stigma TaxID=117547 RepID=A0AAN9UE46_9PEZI
MAAPYAPLVPITSRWKSLPNNAQLTDPVVQDRFNLIIYLRNLARPRAAYSAAFTATATEDSRANAGTNYAMGGTGQIGKRAARRQMMAADPNLRALRNAVRAALRQTQRLAIEYRLNAAGAVAEQVAIDGNDQAQPVVDELDALVKLGRTAYDRPDELAAFLGPGLERHFDADFRAEFGSHRHALERSLRWVDNWAQARYRFMEHALRDDPDQWTYFYNNRRLGDMANRLVHDPDLASDCDIAGSTWFDTTAKREMFWYTYAISVGDARILSECFICYFPSLFLPPSPPPFLFSGSDVLMTTSSAPPILQTVLPNPKVVSFRVLTARCPRELRDLTPHSTILPRPLYLGDRVHQRIHQLARHRAEGAYEERD